MVYTLPTFNLSCNVFSMGGGTWATRSLRIGLLPCNLAMGRRVQQYSLGTANDSTNAAAPSILVPPLSDVRDFSSGGQADMIECPAGSGRWYQVLGVDDIGKGFANEHRLVWAEKAFQQLDPGRFFGCQWPVPIP
jgi:hypothetical protein